MDLIAYFPQMHSSSQIKPRVPQRRVSFIDQVDINFVESLACSEHRDDVWFSSEEMHSFKYQAALTLRAITSVMTMAEYAELHIQDTSAFLGFEKYLAASAFQDIENRRNAIIVAVLSEQGRQDRSGISDADALARVSQAVSDLSTRRAGIIGMIHAKTDEWECQRIFSAPATILTGFKG